MTQATTFAPRYGSGVTVAPTAVSASSLLGYDNKSLCLTNLSTTQTAYVRTGEAAGGTVTASSADYPIPALAQVSISKPDDHDTIAYVCPGGTGSLHIMAGEGF